jgi:hypothetical protein
MPFGIGFVVEDLAEGVAGRDVHALHSTRWCLCAAANAKQVSPTLWVNGSSPCTLYSVYRKACTVPAWMID